VTRSRIGAATVLALVAAGLVGSASPAAAAPVEHITNGTFETGTSPWWSTANTTLAVRDGRLCADVPGGTANPWDVALGHNGIPLVDGAAYTLTFTATAGDGATVTANVQLNEAPYTTVLSTAVTPDGTARTQTFTSGLTATDGTFTLQLGGKPDPYTFCLDDVSLTSDSELAPEQIENGDFSDGTGGWYSYGTTSTAVDDGRLCSVVPGGLANPWDAGVGQNDVPLIAGSAYTLSFDAAADPAATVRVAVQLGADPFTGYFSRDLALTAAGDHYEFTFTAPDDTPVAQVAFQVGANPAGYRFCLDNVSLRGGEAEPPYVPDTGPRVRVNQVGYLPDGPKRATLVTDATTVVASGTTTPRGLDAASGQNTHTIDFTGYAAQANDLTLVADGETSHPFDVTKGVYDRLRSDSLQFFYIQRSGIAIDGGLVSAEYARPAGHLGVAPNQGDTDVPCQPGVCGYRLDARGGWYDAGDHGKYVVNGGIATASC